MLFRSYGSEFLGIVLIHFLAVISPGPDFAVAIRQSVRHGRRVGIWTALGIGAGISVHVLYTLVGISALPFLVSLAFAIAASANFPVLLLSVLWKGCTTRGAVIGGFLGLASSVILTVLSAGVWEAVLGNPAGSALFPYSSPALFSVSIAFIGIWLFSILDKSPAAQQERAAFAAQQVRSETGLGAAKASSH